MSAWRVLDLSGFSGQVSYEPGHWVMRYADGATRRSALTDAHTALLGPDCQVSSEAMGAAGRFGVTVFFCDTPVGRQCG